MDTELDPEGNPIDGMTLALRELHTKAAKSSSYKPIKYTEKSHEKDVSEPMPDGEFKLSREAYLKLLEQCKGGDVTYVKLQSRHEVNKKQTNVIFFGANFDNEYPAKNLYKALNVAKPDVVMV